MSRLYARWHVGGLVLAVGLGALVAWRHGHWSDLRVLLVLSLVTLLLHQAEEYGWPGGFPRMVNTAVFRSDDPDRFPLDQRTAWLVNVALGWTLYGAVALLAEDAIWLAVASLVVSAGNVVAHTVLFNVRGRTLYNPGLATSWLLFVPVLVGFVVVARRDDLVGPAELAVGLVLGLAISYLGVIRLITVLGDRATPYAFAPAGRPGLPGMVVTVVAVTLVAATLVTRIPVWAEGVLLPTGDWRLVSMTVDGDPVDLSGGPRQGRLLVDPDEDRVSGSGLCNDFSGPRRVGDGELTSTAMSCGPETDAIETAFPGALADLDTFELDGDRLTLHAAGTELVLTRVGA